MITHGPSTLGILQSTLEAERLRSQTIAHNLANADVPGYKRQDVVFEKEMLRALKADPLPFKAKMTDSRHLSFYEAPKHDVKAKVVTQWNTNYLNNGSNVDPDLEAVAAAKSAERYVALTSFIDRHFRSIRTAIGR